MCMILVVACPPPPKERFSHMVPAVSVPSGRTEHSRPCIPKPRIYFCFYHRVPYVLLLLPSLSREDSLIWWFFRSLLPKFCDFLKMLFAGVAHAVGNEKRLAPPPEIWMQIGALSYAGHWAVIHTLLRFQNRKVGGASLAHEKHCGWAMISVERCVFVTGVPPQDWRPCRLPRADVQPWSSPPVSEMALSLTLGRALGVLLILAHQESSLRRRACDIWRTISPDVTGFCLLFKEPLWRYHFSKCSPVRRQKKAKQKQCP